MDSLTQIILGAAVGEVSLGKKIGNRAMLWGAIAGTIPDLDVFVANIFMDEIHGLAFHRAITHSIFFAVFFSFLMAFFANWIYTNGFHKRFQYKLASLIIGILAMVGMAFIVLFINKSLGGDLAFIIGCIIVGAIVGYFSYRLYFRYFKVDQETISIGWVSWYKLFFWSIFTHPLLDCFTTYGTQLFAPFSNYRVAFNNISVADPLYTFPFMMCLLIASFLGRHFGKENSSVVIDKSFTMPQTLYRSRGLWNWAGIIISSCYMLWTIYNKHKVNNVLEDTLKAEHISYSRYMTNPSILNNILWTGTVETDSAFLTGQYSLLDKERKFKLYKIPKGHELLGDTEGDEVIDILKWFSNDYFAVIKRQDGKLQLNDMRYGTFRGKPEGENSYIFKFALERGNDGNYQLDEATGGPPRGGEDRLMGELWNRIKGI